MRKTLRLLRNINEDIAEAKKMIRKLKREEADDIAEEMGEALVHVNNAAACIQEAHNILNQIYTECYED